jgi:hypothetical protein
LECGGTTPLSGGATRHAGQSAETSAHSKRQSGGVPTDRNFFNNLLKIFFAVIICRYSIRSKTQPRKLDGD